MIGSDRVHSRTPPAPLDLALLVLRVMLGGMMCILHGWPKLLRVASLSRDAGVRFPDPFGLGAAPSLVLAAGVEGLAAVLLVLGLATRLSAAALAGTMAVAVIAVHGGALHGEHSGELALVYLVGFVTLAIAGGGRFTVATWSARRAAA